MDLREDIKSVTYMKTKPAELLESVNKNRRAVVITQNGEARAVLQDVATYETNRKALLFLKLMTQSERDITRGRVTKHKDLMRRLERKFNV